MGQVSAFADGIVALAPSAPSAEITALLNKNLALMRAKEGTIANCKAALAAV